MSESHKAELAASLSPAAILPRPLVRELRDGVDQPRMCKDFVVVGSNGRKNTLRAMGGGEEPFTQFERDDDAELLALHVDAGLSGAKAHNRPALQSALTEACKHKAALVVYSLSRLARSTKDAIAIRQGSGAVTRRIGVANRTTNQVKLPRSKGFFIRRYPEPSESSHLNLRWPLASKHL